MDDVHVTINDKYILVEIDMTDIDVKIHGICREVWYIHDSLEPYKWEL